jgi:signal transduction histidine kinase
LAKLIYHYKLEKASLLQKHKTVQNFINNHDLNVSLDEIHLLINAGKPDKPYNIYITDKNLTIQNTTYNEDLGFNLTFAKSAFDDHKKQNIIGSSYPIRETKNHNFFSYSDSYLTKDGDEKAALLQVSYTYENLSKELVSIENLIQQNPNILDVKAYYFGQDNFIYNMMSGNDPSYIPSSDTMLSVKKKAQQLSQKMDTNDLITEYFRENGTHYQLLYMADYSPISEDLKIIYTILLNDEDYHTQIYRLNLFMLFSIIVGLIGIFTIAKVRNKEILLSEQDTFVQSAMHEIKTPLSVITLNNELRELELGKDIYSEEINVALKLLHHSYNSMGYIISKNELVYTTETVDLSKILQERIDFFQSIAKANHKSIVADIERNCHVEISPIELNRLIDNNLSNAIKYSNANSVITIRLNKNILSFHSEGEIIKDKEKIFDKYVRENTTVGGYGLGLSIVQDIAEKYFIDIMVDSDIDKGTTFTYLFQTLKNKVSL